MRKFACLLVVLVLVASSTAFADEILFRDIPWGSSPSQVNDLFRGTGFPKFYVEQEKFMSSFGDGYYDFDMEYSENGGYYANLFHLQDCYVAGHSINYLTMSFMYEIEKDEVIIDEENSQLVKATYAIECMDKFLVYEDLKGKLTILYGEPESIHIEVAPINTEYKIIRDGSVWYGENNTGVFLKMEWNTIDGKTEEKYDFVGEDTLYLEYGKTDTKEYLLFINQFWENKAIIREKDAIESNTTNIDGL